MKVTITDFKNRKELDQYCKSNEVKTIEGSKDELGRYHLKPGLEVYGAVVVETNGKK